MTQLLAAGALGALIVVSPALAAPPELRLVVPEKTHQATTFGKARFATVTPAYLVNRGGPLEIHAHRANYAEPIRSSRIVDGIAEPLGTKTVRWGGLVRAAELVVLRPNGTALRRVVTSFCPNEGTRFAASGPSHTSFPFTCANHPLMRGAVMGLDTEWGAPLQFSVSRIPPGRHRVRVRILQPVAAILGVPPDKRVIETVVRVTAARDGGEFTGDQFFPVPSPPPETSAGVGAPDGELPDLAGLPAFAVTVNNRASRGGARSYLKFGATVWNAGPGPLVVEGFRRPRSLLMNGVQLFYSGGREVRSSPVGLFDYDTRDGHEHWHFRDFARYSLITERGRRVAGSGKEAWCLVPTDQINLLVPGADRHPGSPSLSTSCGGQSAPWVREVLEAGSGDTYGPDLPGQLFEITNVPNGRYLIKIEANPIGRLTEVTRTNNIAYRAVVLGGKPGERTVRVPKLGRVDTEGFFGTHRGTQPTTDTSVEPTKAPADQ